MERAKWVWKGEFQQEMEGNVIEEKGKNMTKINYIHV